MRESRVSNKLTAPLFSHGEIMYAAAAVLRLQCHGLRLLLFIHFTSSLEIMTDLTLLCIIYVLCSFIMHNLHKVSDYFHSVAVFAMNI